MCKHMAAPAEDALLLLLLQMVMARLARVS
jgi:hypothetical protein